MAKPIFEDRTIKTARLEINRADMETPMSCRCCTQLTSRCVAAKYAEHPQWIITVICDDCFDLVKQLPTRNHDIQVVNAVPKGVYDKS